MQIIYQKNELFVTSYDRNPDVVAEVLLKANGVCECCNTSTFVKPNGDPSGRKFNNSIKVTVPKELFVCTSESKYDLPTFYIWVRYIVRLRLVEHMLQVL